MTVPWGIRFNGAITRYRALVSLAFLTIAFASASCLHADKFGGMFQITSVEVNSKTVSPEFNGEQVQCQLTQSRLTLRPVWLADGREVEVILETNGDNSLVIDQFSITQVRPDTSNKSVTGSGMLPYYYIADENGRRRLTLPARVTSTVNLGLASENADVARGLFRIMIGVSDSSSGHYDIQIDGYRKVRK